MANTTKSTTLLDDEQTLTNAFNDSDKSFTTSTFVTAKLGHKITQTAIDPVTDDFTYLDGATVLYTLRVIYTSAAKTILLSVERTV